MCAVRAAKITGLKVRVRIKYVRVSYVLITVFDTTEI